VRLDTLLLSLVHFTIVHRTLVFISHMVGISRQVYVGVITRRKILGKSCEYLDMSEIDHIPVRRHSVCERQCRLSVREKRI
jgi:hypothetical protein